MNKKQEPLSRLAAYGYYLLYMGVPFGLFLGICLIPSPLQQAIKIPIPILLILWLISPVMLFGIIGYPKKKVKE